MWKPECNPSRTPDNLSRRASAALTALCLLLSIAGQRALAQPPEVESVQQLAGQRGSEFVARVIGERLDTVSDLLFYNPGLTLVSYSTDEEGEAAEIRLRSAEDCPVGDHPFWMVGSGGPSRVRLLKVTARPWIDEAEPNNEVQQSQAFGRTQLEEGVAIAGVVEGADVDVFRFELEAGERLSAEVEAMRLGGAFLDAFLEIRGPKGEVIAAADDSDLFRQDPLLSIVAKTGGPHYVAVRDSAFDGEYQAGYRLHVGRFAQPKVAYPPGGKPGESLQARLIGDARGAFTAAVTLPSEGEGIHQHRSDDGEGGPSPSTIPFRVSDLRNVLEAEPDSSQSDPTPAGRGPFALNGVLTEGDEADFFRFEASSGEQFQIEVFGTRIGSPIDSVLEVFGPGGEVVARNDDSAVHDSKLMFTAVDDGSHTIRVSDHLGRSGPSFVYRIECAPERPSLKLTGSPLSTSMPMAGKQVTLAPGGRFAMLVSTTRFGFHGPVQVDADGLPPGVRVIAEPVGEEGHLCQVLFEAAPSAKPRAGLVGFSGIGLGGAQTVQGAFQQRYGLVLGEPRRTIYHDVELDRIPLTITEQQPFTLSAEPPLATLAQDGLLEVVVEANRFGGFEGPITLSTLMLPKWIEASEDKIVIPSGESTVRFPLIASDRAEPGEHPIILVGNARVDGTSVAASTQQFQIEVAEPYASLAIDFGAVEQGSPTEVVCTLDWFRLPESPSTARLMGLPKDASAPDLSVSPTDREIVFPVEVGSETPASIHNSLYVELSVPESGEVSRQYVGRGGTLEVLERGAQARSKESRLQTLRREQKTAAARPLLSD